MRALGIVLIAGCGFQSPAGTTDGASPDPGATGSGSLQCPMSYNVALSGSSRYRLIIDGHRAWEQSDACNVDAPAATHLVVIETLQEFADIKAFLLGQSSGLAGDGIWIGAVQRMNATSLRDGWLGFDGADLFNGWGNGEPNDGSDNNENNHEEQFAGMEKNSSSFIDFPGSSSFGALCECDGKPIDPTVANLVASYH